MEAVTFPDVESVVIDYLSGALTDDSATIATAVPTTRPDRLVKVTRTGGLRASVGHELAQVTMECWDTTGPAAAALTRLVRGHLAAMHYVDGDIVCAFVREVGGPAFFPDALTGMPRYRMTVQLVQKSQTL